MRRIVAVLFAAVLISLPLTVSAHHYLKQNFFAYDGQTKEGITGATFTVFYDGGSVSGQTSGPHGDVEFWIPGESEYADVTLSAPGYCSASTTVRLGFRPHVGGRGFWVGLTPCP